MKLKNLMILLLAAAAMLFAASAVSAAGAVSFAIGSAKGNPGETVEFVLTVSSSAEVTALGLTDLEYDAGALAFEGFGEYGDAALGSITGALGFDEEKTTIALGYMTPAAVSGTICHIRFRITDGAAAGEYSVRMKPVAKRNSENLSAEVSQGVIAVRNAGQGAPHQHAMTHVGAVLPNCHATGNTEYWKCEICGGMFADPNGENGLKMVSLPKDPNSHDGGTAVRNAVEATESRDGYTGDTYCLGCGADLVRGSRIPAAGNGGAPTDPGPSVEIPQDPASPETPPAPEISPAGDGAAQEWINPFRDVSPEDEWYEAVRFVNQNGLFYGMSNTEFGPYVTMTRAMFVTVLGRLEGVNTELFLERSFDDVPLNMWYSPYVSWANQAGIVKGYSASVFGLDDEITVEQAVVIIARYAGYRGYSTDSSETLEGYADAGFVSDWAWDQMRWAVETGVYRGDSALLRPQDKAPRSLIARMLYAYVSMTNGN